MILVKDDIDSVKIRAIENTMILALNTDKN